MLYNFHIITDYTSGDLAFSEVVSTMNACLTKMGSSYEYRFITTSVPRFSTIEAGFCLRQLASGTDKEIIYCNCAPRRDLPTERIYNEGEDFCYGLLKNGTKIFFVDSGYILAFFESNDFLDFKKADIGLTQTKIQTQFRSRDIFPHLISTKLRYPDTELFQECPLNIRKPENSFVAYIDNFGNIKTSVRQYSQLGQLLFGNQGKTINVGIQDVFLSAKISGCNFSVKEGELSLGLGSSGYENPFFELFLRGGSAKEAFDAKAGHQIYFNF